MFFFGEKENEKEEISIQLPTFFPFYRKETLWEGIINLVEFEESKLDEISGKEFSILIKQKQTPLSLFPNTLDLYTETQRKALTFFSDKILGIGGYGMVIRYVTKEVEPRYIAVKYTSDLKEYEISKVLNRGECRAAKILSLGQNLQNKYKEKKTDPIFAFLLPLYQGSLRDLIEKAQKDIFLLEQLRIKTPRIIANLIRKLICFKEKQGLFYSDLKPENILYRVQETKTKTKTKTKTITRTHNLIKKSISDTNNFPFPISNIILTLGDLGGFCNNQNYKCSGTKTYTLEGLAQWCFLKKYKYSLPTPLYLYYTKEEKEEKAKKEEEEKEEKEAGTMEKMEKMEKVEKVERDNKPIKKQRIYTEFDTIYALAILTALLNGQELQCIRREKKLVGESLIDVMFRPNQTLENILKYIVSSDYKNNYQYVTLSSISKAIKRKPEEQNLYDGNITKPNTTTKNINTITKTKTIVL